MRLLCEITADYYGDLPDGLMAEAEEMLKVFVNTKLTGARTTKVKVLRTDPSEKYRLGWTYVGAIGTSERVCQSISDLLKLVIAEASVSIWIPAGSSCVMIQGPGSKVAEIKPKIRDFIESIPNVEVGEWQLN